MAAYAFHIDKENMRPLWRFPRALGEPGAAVAVTSGSLDSARAAAAALAKFGIDSYGMRLEVRDSDEVERAVEAVSAAFGPIDVLVNNAGIRVSGAAFDTPDSEWCDVMGTNVDGVWHCCRSVGRRMQAWGGVVIVNVGSMSAEIVNRPRWQAPYLAWKSTVTRRETLPPESSFAPLSSSPNAAFQRSSESSPTTHSPTESRKRSKTQLPIPAAQKFIKPHCPWTNGKVERLNRSLATEWAYRQAGNEYDRRVTTGERHPALRVRRAADPRTCSG
jgi:hypothetical protein